MFRVVVFIIFLLCSNTLVYGQSVKLITIGPGDEFWSAFGHTALAIDDQVFGFGYFSFEDEELIKSFIFNQMNYEIGVSEFNDEVNYAEWQNRTFNVQNINLTETEKFEIIQYLNWHNLPENQSYPYDYFYNNCSTKVRDVINQIWSGSLQKRFIQSSHENYFSQYFPAPKQSLMNMGLVLASGWPAYQQRTDWELMAFPGYLHDKLSELSELKVGTSQVLYQATTSSWSELLWSTHWFIMVFSLTLLLLLITKKSRSLTVSFIGIYQLLLGLVMLFFWFFTEHEIMSWNFNILLFSPLAVFVKKIKNISWFLAASYFLWMVLAVTIGALYLFPLWIINCLSLWMTLRRT